MANKNKTQKKTRNWGAVAAHFKTDALTTELRVRKKYTRQDLNLRPMA